MEDVAAGSSALVVGNGLAAVLAFRRAADMLLGRRGMAVGR
jgi:hypothetical protein